MSSLLTNQNIFGTIYLMVKKEGKKELSEKLRAVFNNVNKKFGEGSLRRLGDKPIEKVDALSTRSFVLDTILGVGGLPKGRITEIYGGESSGKSTLALQVAASAQEKGETVAYIDAEHALDPDYAIKLGLDLDSMLISQPSSGEEALEIVDAIVQSGEVGLIVVDSVSALVPQSELDGEMGDSQMGKQARLMSQALRKLVGNVRKNNVALVFINQLRNKIGVMFGDPNTTTGGKALPFYASVRIKVSRVSSLKDGEEVIGHRVKFENNKNKVAPPYKKCETDLIYGKGFSAEGDVVDLATDLKIIEKSGAWYSFEGNQLGQGREKVKSLLESDKELFEKLKNLILAKLEK